MGADTEVTTSWAEIATGVNRFVGQNKGVAVVYVVFASALPAASSFDGFTIVPGANAIDYDAVAGRNVYVRTGSGESALAFDAI